MKKLLEDLLIHALVGAGTVAVSVPLLGELIGAPLELSPVEWVLALGAGALLTVPGYLLGILHWHRLKKGEGGE